MQLKEAYHRRIQQEKESARKKQLQKINAPPPIGSVKLEHINYKAGDRFFADYKVSDQVKESKKQTKDFLDPDILELKKTPWNMSVSVPDNFEKEESHRQNLLKIRLGLKDHGYMPSIKPRKRYDGTDTRDSFANWNVSTFFTKKEKDDGYSHTNLNAYENSIRKNSAISNYQKPIKRFEQSRLRQKQEEDSHLELYNSLQSSLMFTYPTASPERIHAYTRKQLQEYRTMKRKQESAYSTSQTLNKKFTANLTPTQKQKISVRHYHTGKWQKAAHSHHDSESDGEEHYAWSCCQSEQKSGGCAYRIRDGNKPNYRSFVIDG